MRYFSEVDKLIEARGGVDRVIEQAAPDAVRTVADEFAVPFGDEHADEPDAGRFPDAEVYATDPTPERAGGLTGNVFDLSPIRRGRGKKSDEPPAPVDVDSLFEKMLITEDYVRDLEETHFLWRRIVAAAHLCVIAAPGGSGKSMIARKAAEDMAADGMRVMYFMEDAGATDFKFLQKHAADNDYRLFNSTVGHKSPEDVFEMIRTVSLSATRLENTVMILDTMKKFLDVMGKKGARDFFQVLRALTSLGATVILLAHTNKHKDLNNKLIFEGVGDVRNDVDELFYIEAIDQAAPGGIGAVDRIATITPDKARCAAEAASFRLDRQTLEAVSAPLTDVHALAEAALRERQDAHVIAAVEAILRARGGEQMERLVLEVAESTSVGREKCRGIVRGYSDAYGEHGVTPRWNVTRTGKPNEKRVSWPPERG